MSDPAARWAAAPTPPPAIRPGVGRFWLAGGLALAGIIGAAALLVWTAVGFVRTIDGFARVPVPGEAVVEVSSAGGYTLYVEGRGTADGFVPFVPVEVTPADGGGPLELRPYSGRITYTSGSREGRAISSVEIPRPGTYRITTGGPPRSVEVAFGRGLGRGLAPRIGGGIALGLLGVGAGAVLAIVTGVQRGRARRAMAVVGAPPSPWDAQPAQPTWPAPAAPPTPSWPDQPGWPAQPPPPPPPPPPTGGRPPSPPT